jgi:hypothetical protein
MLASFLGNKCLFLKIGLNISRMDSCLPWWHTAAISAISRWGQEDHKFKASLSYIVRPCLKKQRNNKQTKKGWIRSCRDELGLMRLDELP